MAPSDTTHRAAAALRAAHDDPLLHARDWAARGRPVVGYVGADTPVELITAAGALPVRLTGRPGRDTRRARAYLDGAVDPHTVNLLAGLLAPEGLALDLLVLTHDCDASVQLFHTLRELRRIRAEELPPSTSRTCCTCRARPPAATTCAVCAASPTNWAPGGAPR